MNKIDDFKTGTIYVSKLGNEFIVCDCDYDYNNDEILYNIISLNCDMGNSIRIFNNPMNKKETIKKLNTVIQELGLEIK